MVNNPLTWGMSGWDMGKQLTQTAQGLTLALLLTHCYGTGQASLSASVSLSGKQRSKYLICLKAGGVNQRFLVRRDLRWCLWFLCQTLENFRFQTWQSRSQQALLPPHFLYQLQTAMRDTLLKSGAK